MATNLRGSGACQHFVHPGSARLRLSHHRLQFASGQDPRRQAHSTRFAPLPSPIINVPHQYAQNERLAGRALFSSSFFKMEAFSDIELFVAVAPLNQPDMQRCV